MTGYPLIECLCCGSNELRKVLDLGEQPPANSYSISKSEVLQKFPLGLNVCSKCWHAQLSYCVNREELFDNYSYVSGTSATLSHFFSWFAKALSRVMKPGATVLELAANDGSLIREMKSVGLECVGIDPAVNIVKKAQAEGLPILCGYWPQVGLQLDQNFDAIICMNVVAHVDDPLSFLVGCKQKLAPDGIIIVQPSQARMFENCEFDTIYHEHISFFNSNSIAHLAQRAGLKLVEAFLVKIHGDSPVYVLQHEDASMLTAIRPEFSIGDFMIDDDLATYENRIMLFSKETYARFGERSNEIIHSLLRTVEEHLMSGFDVVFVGAAAKAMTVINAAGIKPQFFVDESPLKIGLYAPGCNSLIEPLTAVKNLVKPTLFVMCAWNFRYELAEKLKLIGVPEGSKFFAYFPKPEVF